MIADNGIGFNIAAVKGCIGMANIKRRVELFSVIFKVELSTARSCIVKVDILLNEIILWRSLVKQLVLNN